jgi:phosphatidylglycerophosphate synthase
MRPRKQGALDEWFDAVFCRPLARGLAERVAQHTRLSPNQITLASGLVGVIAGGFYASSGLWILVGGVLFLTMMVLDCADGDLARLRGGGTWRGRVYDGVADLATAISVHVGICLNPVWSEMSYGPWHLHPAVPWVLAAIAGASMSWNCGVVDGVKQRLKSGSIDQDVGKYAADVSSWVDRLTYAFLVRYVKRIDAAAGKQTRVTATVYRRVQWVGPTHHHLWMVLCALVASVWPPALPLYFFMAIVPANLYLAAVLLHARLAGRSDDVAVTD